jgi:hypothetical protein
MITELPNSKDGVLGFEIKGKVTLEQEKEWIEKFEQAIQEHEQLNILLYLGDHAAWGIESGYEDLKWIATHYKNFNKVAVVSASNIWKWFVALDSPFAKIAGIEEKHFKPEELDTAWEFVKS